MRALATLSGIALGMGAIASPAAAITWGEPDHEHTAVGAMIVENPAWSDGKIMFCSGTLIHPQVVLTAGHCTGHLDFYGITSVEFTLGQNASEGELLEVAYVVTHPEYGYGPYANPYDVGLLVLAEPVADVEPAVLPELGYLDALQADGVLKHGSERAEFTAVGYGASAGDPPPAISFEDQRQSAVSVHQQLLNAWLRTDQNQAHDNGGTCLGDSGGAILYDDGEDEVLVALTAWGDTNCVSMGFNYRTDIPETQDFIDSVIADL